MGDWKSIWYFTKKVTNLLQHSTQNLRVKPLIRLQIYAPSLTSLRQRDWNALIELFDREDGDEVESDINSNLHLMMPEPCWGDDPFDFLREYM